MLHETLYNGPKIDELLEAVLHIKTVVNGWVKLESSEDNKINFNELTNPGNFSFSYWVNGPTGVTYTPPLNAIITKEGKYIRQYIFNSGFNSEAYSRLYDANIKTFTAWEKVGIPNGAYAQETAPTNPKENNIWINSSGKNSIIQYFDKNTSSWKSVNPFDYMDKDIYNPDESEFTRGIYQYIDNKITNISGGSVTVDFHGHINDNSIHISATEKKSYDNKMRSDILLSSIQTVVDSLSEYIAKESQESGVDISAIESLATQVQEFLNTHINDTIKHPTAAQIANWNSKANADHTHSEDEITISTSDVIGNIPLELIPEEAKEKQVNVKTTDEMLALTKEQIHNGCFVFVNSDDSNDGYLYIVADDTKLGTMNAFIYYGAPTVELNWENIENKPTTVDELGAAISNLQFNSMNTRLDDYTSDAELKMNTVYTDAVTCLNSQDSSSAMENFIDLIDYKLQLIKSLAITQS